MGLIRASWGWVNDDIMFIFGWTVSLRVCMKYSSCINVITLSQALKCWVSPLRVLFTTLGASPALLQSVTWCCRGSPSPSETGGPLLRVLSGLTVVYIPLWWWVSRRPDGFQLHSHVLLHSHWKHKLMLQRFKLQKGTSDLGIICLFIVFIKHTACGHISCWKPSVSAS